MTCKEFRESPALVSEMRKVFENETLKLWIETYRNDPTENPVKKSAPIGITPTDALILLGEQTAWSMCLDRFLLGGKPREGPPKPEEQSYATPPDET